MYVPSFIFLSGQCLMKAHGNPASAHHVLHRSIFISAIISMALTAPFPQHSWVESHKGRADPLQSWELLLSQREEVGRPGESQLQLVNHLSPNPSFTSVQKLGSHTSNLPLALWFASS